MFLVALLVVGTAAAMAGGFRAPGSEFDEGIAVAFPDRVLHGAVPYRDFESFYGPANTYLTAAVFKVFGSSIYSERAIGLGVALVTIMILYLLGRQFGRVAAFGAGLVGALLLAGVVVAKAEHEAQAFALLSLAALVAAATHPEKRTLWWVAGGSLAAVALLFRLELLPAVLLAAPPLLVWGDWRRNAFRYLSGFVVGLLPYAVIAAVVGGHKLHRNFSDLRETGADRRLPFPGPGSDEGRLLIVALVTSVLLVAVGAWHMRTHGRTIAGSLLLSGGVLAILDLPIALWRLDDGHIVSASVIPLTFLPMAAALVDPPRSWAHSSRALIVGGVTALVVLLSLGTHAIRGNVHRNLQIAMGKSLGHPVSYHGRSFFISSAPAAHDLQKIVDTLGARARPAETLFVGPSDLRRTNRNDAFVYYLFPRLKPASFNLELDPPASKPGSPLPGEIGRADYAVLTSRWNAWTEPNASRRYGSTAANDVIRRRFCLIERVRTYELLRRCH